MISNFLETLYVNTSYLGMKLQLEIENSQWVAPMPDICQQWQEKGQIEFDWYFDQAQKYGAERIVFNSLKMNSELFQTLNEKSREKKLAPVHVVTTEQFCELENLAELLGQGVQFAILIYSPLSTELICKIEEHKNLLEQFQFVILARKDWNVRNCYRSIPHFMRERLFVDFPVSLHSTDPFFEASEVGKAKEKLQEDFRESSVPSFCPHLALFNEWSQKNISHFSQPRKLSKTKPLVSLIAIDADDLKELEESKVLEKYPEKLEILITRVAGQKTKVIPKFKSVTTTKYWAHPIDGNKPVSKMALANFTATQADGEVLLFLSGSDLKQLDVLLPLLFEGHGDFAKMLARKSIFAFKKQTFMEKCGFDELIRSWEGQKLMSLVNFYGEEKVSDLFSDDWGEIVKESREPTDRLLMAHTFSKKIKNFDFIDGSASKSKEDVEKENEFERRRYLAAQARDKYLSLYSATPKVALDGHVSYITNPIVKFFRRFGWRLNPMTYLWKLHAVTIIPLISLWNLNGWKMNPKTHSSFWKVRSQLLRTVGTLKFYLNPFSYRLTWKLIYFPAKAYPRVNQFFWDAHQFYWSKIYAPVSRVSWKLYYTFVPPLVQLYWKGFYGPITWLYWRGVYTPINQFYWKGIYAPINWLYWKVIYRAFSWVYWKSVYAIPFTKRLLVSAYWTVYPIKNLVVRAYWASFQLAYPLRKIYYFIHFQYEKRVLGLHRRQKLDSGGSH